MRTNRKKRDSREVIVTGSRGSGKTFRMLSSVYEHAESEPKSKIAVMTARGATAMRHIVREYMDLVQRFTSYEMSEFRFHEHSSAIEHPNGSMVHFVAHEDRLRGWRVDLLAVDVGDPLSKYRHYAHGGRLLIEMGVGPQTEIQRQTFDVQVPEFGDSVFGGSVGKSGADYIDEIAPFTEEDWKAAFIRLTSPDGPKYPPRTG